MPASASFPSGHTASGFAFTNAVAHTLPAAAGPLGLLASAVGYARIHTGVHYPGDVVIGAAVTQMPLACVTASLVRMTL